LIMFLFLFMSSFLSMSMPMCIFLFLCKRTYVVYVHNLFAPTAGRMKNFELGTLLKGNFQRR
jgi:hypothetical protein